MDETKWIDEETGEHLGYIFGEQRIYDKDEFIETIVHKNKELESELNVANMEMLNILTMTNQSLHQEQSEMMMEIMTLISELQGGV